MDSTLQQKLKGMALFDDATTENSLGEELGNDLAVDSFQQFQQFNSGTMVVEISSESAREIERLFGDPETSDASSSSSRSNPSSQAMKVHMPLEVCELIYRQLREQQLAREVQPSEQPPGFEAALSISTVIQQPSTAEEEEKDRRLGFVLQLQEHFPNLSAEEVERYSHCHEYDYPKVFKALKTISAFKSQMSACATASSPDPTTITTHQRPSTSTTPSIADPTSFPSLGSTSPPPPPPSTSPPPSHSTIPWLLPSSKNSPLIKHSQSPTPIPFAAKSKEPYSKAAIFDNFLVLANGDATMHDVEALREEAKRLQALKRDYQQKGSDVMGSQPHVFSHYMKQARDYDRQAKEKLQEADMALFGMQSSQPSIDLHTLTVQRAQRMLKLKIDYLRERHPSLKKLQVITGYGRGRKKTSVVKSALMAYLDKKNIANHVESNNYGVIIVELSTVKERLSSAEDFYDYDEG